MLKHQYGCLKIHTLETTYLTHRHKFDIQAYLLIKIKIGNDNHFLAITGHSVLLQERDSVFIPVHLTHNK